MKTHHAISKKQSLKALLPGLVFVMLLVAIQACSDPVSTNEAALETETAARVNLSTAEDNQGASDDDDRDDANAPDLGGDDDGGSDDGTLDGDYPDINRPGNLVICHAPAGGTPQTLSIAPDQLAAFAANADSYDGPCKQEDSGNGSPTDQGDNDRDDPNAASVGNNDDGGGDDDGTLDGDYPDINRPGNVVICHAPAGGTPQTLSIVPDQLAAFAANAGSYDGPCKQEDNGNGSPTDQGGDDQDDPNAAPVGGSGGGNDNNLNNGRGSSGL